MIPGQSESFHPGRALTLEDIPMSMLTLFVDGREIMKMGYAHLPFHTPARTGDRSWKIVEDGTGKVLDSFTPPKPKKPVPITRYKGSWAESMELRAI
jgi:hypothetical protein